MVGVGVGEREVGDGAGAGVGSVAIDAPPPDRPAGGSLGSIELADTGVWPAANDTGDAAGDWVGVAADGAG